MDSRINEFTSLKSASPKDRPSTPLNEEGEAVHNEAQRSITDLPMPIPGSQFEKKTEIPSSCPCLDGVNEDLRNYVHSLIAEKAELIEIATGLEIYAHNLKNMSNTWMDRSTSLESKLIISRAEARFYKRLFEELQDKENQNETSSVPVHERRNLVGRRLAVADRDKYPDNNLESLVQENKGKELEELLIISKVNKKREADILKIDHDQLSSLGDFLESSPAVPHTPNILKIEHEDERINAYEITGRNFKSSSGRKSERIPKQEKKTPRTQSAAPSIRERLHDRSMLTLADRETSCEGRLSDFKQLPRDSSLERQVTPALQKPAEEAITKRSPVTPPLDEKVLSKYIKLPPIVKVNGGEEATPVHKYLVEIGTKNEMSVDQAREFKKLKTTIHKTRGKETPASRLPRLGKPPQETSSSTVNVHSQKPTIKAVNNKHRAQSKLFLPQIKSTTAKEQRLTKGSEYLTGKVKATLLPDLPSKFRKPQKVQQPKHPFVGKSRELPPVVDLLHNFSQRRD